VWEMCWLTTHKSKEQRREEREREKKKTRMGCKRSDQEKRARTARAPAARVA